MMPYTIEGAIEKLNLASAIQALEFLVCHTDGKTHAEENFTPTETTMDFPEVRFDRDSAQQAGDEWGFNCGPGALCAVLGKTPSEIRAYMGDFEKKGYTNPTLMASILRNLNAPIKVMFQGKADSKPDNPRDLKLYPRFGLVRVQWGGPWTKPGVPIAARYRHTHWVACRFPREFGPGKDGVSWGRTPLVPEIFDINAIIVGGWLPWSEWADELMPWLQKQAVPKGDGTWWPTHSWELLHG
jgi:hypothetical protein